MHRRAFVRLLAAAPFAEALRAKADKAPAGQAAVAKAAAGQAETAKQTHPDLPTLRVVSRSPPAAAPGMPGPYPGRVVSVTSEKSVDTATGTANGDVVREMMARGMRRLTGAHTTADARGPCVQP